MALHTRIPGDRPELGALLSSSGYVRARRAPSVWDGDYLANQDLAAVVAAFAKQTGGRVFDYGCGGSPYQTFFGHCTEYVRADVTPGPGIDRLLTTGSLTQEPSDRYDIVLSTQVLEHVQNPAAYLAESLRILKSGGQLFVTTHGMYEEHRCPHDYFRWTSEGLEELVRSSGLQVVESYKLTTELRCIIQMVSLFAQHLCYPGNSLVHYPLLLGRSAYNRLFRPLLNLVGRTLGRQGVLPAGSPSSLYIGLAIRARKP